MRPNSGRIHWRQIREPVTIGRRRSFEMPLISASKAWRRAPNWLSSFGLEALRLRGRPARRIVYHRAVRAHDTPIRRGGIRIFGDRHQRSLCKKRACGLRAVLMGEPPTKLHHRYNGSARAATVTSFRDTGEHRHLPTYCVQTSLLW